MLFRYLTVKATLLVLILSSSAAYGDKPSSFEAAKVNNAIIKQATLNLLSQSRAQGSMSGLQQNQDQILEDLITTELLVQAAKRKGTDVHPKNRLELELAQQTLLSQLYVKDFIDSLNISETELREVYNQTGDRAMVQLTYWEFLTQEEANRFLAKFSSSSQLNLPPGETDAWQSLDSLPFYGLAQSDIKQTGDWLSQPTNEGNHWKVWRSENYSSIKKPPYEHVKDAIRQEIAQQKLQEHIRDLRRQAVIVKHNRVSMVSLKPDHQLVADRK